MGVREFRLGGWLLFIVDFVILGIALSIDVWDLTGMGRCCHLWDVARIIGRFFRFLL